MRSSLAVALLLVSVVDAAPFKDTPEFRARFDALKAGATAKQVEAQLGAATLVRVVWTYAQDLPNSDGLAIVTEVDYDARGKVATFQVDIANDAAHRDAKREWSELRVAYLDAVDLAFKKLKQGDKRADVEARLGKPARSHREWYYNENRAPKVGECVAAYVVTFGADDRVAKKLASPGACATGPGQ
jgi:hypothetical protein